MPGIDVVRSPDKPGKAGWKQSDGLWHVVAFRARGRDQEVVLEDDANMIMCLISATLFAVWTELALKSTLASGD